MKTKISRRLGLEIAALLLVGILSASAALLSMHPITTDIQIKAKFSMGVFDVDAETELNYINLGQFEWDTMKYYPGGVLEVPTETYFVNNTDQVSFFISFNWVDMPSGTWGYQFYVKRGDQPGFTGLNNGAIYQFAVESSYNNPDPLTQYVEWYFVLNLSSAPFGTYHPTLEVNAFDSATG